MGDFELEAVASTSVFFHMRRTLCCRSPIDKYVPFGNYLAVR